jgi:RNA polymerase sigma-70 factor (ECF subfamily)
MTVRRRDNIDRLLARKAQLIAFLERRLGSRADAEDLMQTAFLRLIAGEDALRDEDKLVPWFYRLLQNLLTDTYRRRAARAAAESRLAVDPKGCGPSVDDDELLAEGCACVLDVLATLRKSYADILRRVDLEERSLKEVAPSLGVTLNNASVRLHRARAALRKGLRFVCGVCFEHGYLDCNCRARGGREV